MKTYSILLKSIAGQTFLLGTLYGSNAAPVVHIYPDHPSVNPPSNLKKLTASAIQNTQKKTSITLLQDIPGLQIAQLGADLPQSYSKFRGTDPEHTLVQILDVEIADPSDGGRYDFSHLRVSDIETLEVQHSSMHSGIGGGIDIIPFKGSGKPQFQLEMERGSSETQGINFKSQGASSQSHYFVNTDLSMSGDGSLKNKHRGNTTADRSQKQHLTTRLGHFITPHWESEIYLSQIKDKYKINDIRGPLPLNSSDHSVQQQGILIARNQLDTFNKKWQHRFSLSHVTHRRDTVMAAQPSLYTGQTLGAKYESTLAFNTHRFKGFLGLKQDKVTANRLTLPTLKTLQGGLSYQKELIKNLIFEAGTRIEKPSSLKTQQAFFGQVRAQLHPQIAFWTRWGTGFQIPTLGQLFPSSPYMVENHHLKSMTSRQWEIGSELKPFNTLTVTLAYFNLNIKDFITTRPLPGFKYQYFNDNKRLNQGLESTARFRPFLTSSFLAFNTLALRGSYTLLESTTQKTQIRPIRSARHVLQGGLESQISPKTHFFCEGYYQSMMRDTDFATGKRVKLAPHLTLRTGAKYKWTSQIELGGRLENLLNRTQESVYGYPGRGFGLFFSLTLKGPGH